MSAGRKRAWQALPILCGLALLAAYVLRAMLSPHMNGLPGRDSGNLYVWEMFTRSVLATGRLPYWNPFHFAGTPHMADPQTLVLYPPALALRWLPALAFLPWMAALHVWIGGAGALFLSRVIGLGWLTSAAVAIAVMLGGSVGPWLHNGHLLVLFCASWLPWVMGFAILSVRRNTVWPHPLLVVVLALQFLAGYLQGSFYVAAAVSLYFLYSTIRPDETRGAASRWQPLAQLAILGGLTIGVTAFQLLPTLRLAAEAGRSGGIPYKDAVEGAWPFRQLATFFFPFLDAPVESPHRDLPDAVSYVGWLMAAMVPMAFVDRSNRRLVIFFALLTTLAVALASADLPLYRLHHLLLPGMRRPGRVMFLATLGVAILGGIGLERFIALASSKQWRSLVPGVASVMAMAAAAFVASGSRSAAPTPMWPWLPFVAIAGLLLVSALSVASRARAATIVGLMLVIVDLTTFSAGAVTIVPVESQSAVRQMMGPATTGRAISICENRVGPGEMLQNGQPALDGLAGIFLGRYADWAYVARFGDPVPADGLFHGIDSEGTLPARRDLVDLANVSVLFSCRPLAAPALTLVSNHDPVLVYRNESEWPRALWTCGGRILSTAAATRELVDSRYDRDRRLVPETYINVRWAKGVDEERRRAVEEHYRLSEGVALDERTWRYVLDDQSAENVLTLIQDVSVEDTHGVDRRTGAVTQRPAEAVDAADNGDDLVIGTTRCDQRGSVDVLAQDQPDGHVVADVDAPEPGFVFLSEPHYSERRAFVDGVEVVPVTANLAFTAVPVAAGRHRLELKYVPGSFHLGLGITALTLVGWGGVPLAKRLKRSRAEERH
jgi:hypothetical protein